MDPYRAPVPAEEVPPPPRELLYLGNDRDPQRGAVLLAFRLFFGPALVLAVLVWFTGWTVALLGFAGAMAFSISRRKKAVSLDASLLRIDDGCLRIFSADGRIEKQSFKLHQLAGVELDVKTVERMQEAAGPVPGLRFINATVAPPVDTARVVLVGTKGRRYTMTDVYLAHMDVTESVGKIRVFLRKNGWLPASERKPKKKNRPDEEATSA